MQRLCACLLLLLSLTAWADDDETELGHVKMLLSRFVVKVAEDYSYQTDVEISYKVFTDEGVRLNGKYSIGYNRALSSMQILQAETVKADGRRIPVPESAIARQIGSLGLYTMKDQETVNLSWPDFAAGDTVYLHYRTQDKPLFPGFFSLSSWANQSLILDKVEVLVDVPVSFALQQDVQGFIPSRDEVKEGRHLLQWSFNNPKSKKPENRLTDPAQNQAHVWVSTFQDWAAVAKAYMDRHTPQAAITPEIEKLAKELTGDAATEREKAQRIYDWVRKNIRYIALYAGAEGWVPHKASDVLANRFGDCKDHVVLMEAMLRAVGVESVPALIQSDYLTFQLARIPMPGFNHVINYLPGLDLYLDSTSVHTEFGHLPSGAQGKPVVRGTLAETVGRTPIDTVVQNKVKRLTRFVIDDKGNAKAETTIRVGAGYSDWFEQFRAGIAKGKENVWALTQMKKQNRRGTAKLVFLEEKGGFKSFKVSQTIEDFLPDGEIGLREFAPLESGPATVGWITDLFETKTRTGSFACYPTEIEDVVEIALPDRIKLLRLPRNRQVSSEAVKMQVSYDSHGNTHTMKRLFRWTPPLPGSCSAKQWQDWLASVREVRSAVRSASLAYERN